jgi:hypothetical protein
VDDFRSVHNLESLAQLTAAPAHIGLRRDDYFTTCQGDGSGARDAGTGLSSLRLGKELAF